MDEVNLNEIPGRDTAGYFVCCVSCGKLQYVIKAILCSEAGCSERTGDDRHGPVKRGRAGEVSVSSLCRIRICNGNPTFDVIHESVLSGRHDQCIGRRGERRAKHMLAPTVTAKKERIWAGSDLYCRLQGLWGAKSTAVAVLLIKHGQ